MHKLSTDDSPDLELGVCEQMAHDGNSLMFCTSQTQTKLSNKPFWKCIVTNWPDFNAMDILQFSPHRGSCLLIRAPWQTTTKT